MQSIAKCHSHMLSMMVVSTGSHASSCAIDRCLLPVLLFCELQLLDLGVSLAWLCPPWHLGMSAPDPYHAQYIVVVGSGIYCWSSVLLQCTKKVLFLFPVTAHLGLFPPVFSFGWFFSYIGFYQLYFVTYLSRFLFLFLCSLWRKSFSTKVVFCFCLS